MRKWAEKSIWIRRIICLTILLACLGTYCCYKLDLHTGFIRRDPKKIIARLEGAFVVDLPEKFKDARAATAWLGWDNGYTGYIIKFRIEPNALQSFVKLENLNPYDRDADERDKNIIPMPKWYTQPIQRGKMGTIELSSPKYKVDCSADIYIDTSDEKNFIVYMGGVTP